MNYKFSAFYVQKEADIINNVATLFYLSYSKCQVWSIDSDNVMSTSFKRFLKTCIICRAKCIIK